VDKYFSNDSILMFLIVAPMTVVAIVFLRLLFRPGGNNAPSAFETFLRYSDRRAVRQMDFERQKQLLDRNVVILQHPNGSAQILRRDEISGDSTDDKASTTPVVVEGDL
jgi:hypothetical protein